MFKSSLPLLLIAIGGIANAQSPATGTGTAPAAPSGAVSPVEREAAQRGSPAANTGQGTRHGESTYSEGVPDLTARCRTASVHCPVTEPSQSSGSSVTSTDSLPLGSATRIERGAGGPTESQYPTSQGSGSMGSGSTGSPTGPAPGPVNGIGR